MRYCRNCDAAIAWGQLCRDCVRAMAIAFAAGVGTGLAVLVPSC